MKNRINLPANSKELLNLAKQVQQKHVAEGAASPLNALDWAVIGPLIEKVAAAHDRAEAARREMHQSFQMRNLHLPAVRDAVRGFRDALTGKYMRERRVLAQWGFSVQDAKQSPPEEPVEPEQPKT